MSVTHYAFHLRMNHQKYRAAFHEVGHLVMLKSWRPDKCNVATIYYDGLWCGKILPPPNYPHSIDVAKVIVAGVVAETCYEQLNAKEVRRVFESDSRSFGGDWKNYKKNLKATKPERIALAEMLLNEGRYYGDVVEDSGYFPYLHSACMATFEHFGEHKMHRLAKVLYLNGKVIL